MFRDAHARGTELALLVFSAVILGIALVALQFSQGNELNSEVAVLVGGYIAVFGVAHVVLCLKAPNADQIMLPVAAMLNAIGLVMIYRIDLAAETTRSNSQVMWTVIALVIFAGVIWFLKSHNSLQNYAFLLGLGGLVLSALPIVWARVFPSNLTADAQVWITLGPVSIQPGEFAKIMLLIFFAALLVNKRALFSVAGYRVLGLQFPRVRDLGPILLVWGLAILISALQNDFGPALLLFGTVLGMLYMATGRSSWLVLGLGLAVVGVYIVFQISDKIQERFTNFIDPIANYDNTGYQLSQALFGMSFGGLTGTGLGEGYPQNVPVSYADFIMSSIGEELGFVGLAAVLMLFTVFVTRGFIIALKTPDSFGKLVAAGLSLTLAIQVFVVTGGISKLLPMTGLTTPFMSHGGSSLLANYILLAILLKISHDVNTRKAAPRQPVPDADPQTSVHPVVDNPNAGEVRS
ncbi:FtsW/RodA/SpoVE family cell cycle protein [Corynebacterium kalidii]|jgi:cell division protein FtsW (lipid II flippase)|uniref:FtsW/RodA/SpoVE family cell cycle protein n=1 Tax=Corynebacterium kalidii TaxID=2931982 RepID=A0A9X1WFX3_9CORY|nr:FtsW/RodA/SpoVE family cell cycle protein [Corynebacterium kalidii]MCJ7857703.1 FtsW/RodA/SpoVE family cell cycle protein [Corynebacterium kalidii]